MPALDWFSETIDDIEDTVEKPTPLTLQRIFEAKRGLIALRRALSNMRDVAGHLQRLETDMIGGTFFRRFCGTYTITWPATWTCRRCAARSARAARWTFTFRAWRTARTR